MNDTNKSIDLASEPDFALAGLTISPSACRVVGGGRELRVEAKTMAALVIFAHAQGATVTRSELIDACWNGRAISDDAIARTIAKVRSLARIVTPAPFVLETVPKVGYRLLPTNEATETVAPLTATKAGPGPYHQPWTDNHLLETLRRWTPTFAVILALAAMPFLWAAAKGDSGFSTAPPRSPEVMDALMNLDQPRLQLYVERGWDPNWRLDAEGNTALHQVMMVCERNPTGHDKPALLRVVRYLVDNGADWTASNGWGDTPLEIASARRYCGPDHPVVAYLNELSQRTPPQLVGVEYSNSERH